MTGANRKPLSIEQQKVSDYLLNPAKSRGKAAFFVRMGFALERWQEFAEALRQQAEFGTIAAVSKSPYGKRYSIEGALVTPDGRRPFPWIRTIWIEETGADTWRLVTAYPVPRGEE